MVGNVQLQTWIDVFLLILFLVNTFVVQSKYSYEPTSNKLPFVIWYVSQVHGVVDGVKVGVKLGVTDGVLVKLGVTDGVKVWLGVGVRDKLILADGVGVGLVDDVNDGVSDGVGVWLLVTLGVGVNDGVALGVGVTNTHPPLSVTSIIAGYKIESIHAQIVWLCNARIEPVILVFIVQSI